MKKPLKIIAQLVFFFLFVSCQEKQANDNVSDRAALIIPEPAEIMILDGSFKFTPDTRLVVQNEENKKISQLLADKLGTAAGFTPEIVEKAPEKNYLLFKTDDTLEPEAYNLIVSSEAIVIKSNGLSGALYAMETLRQLLPPEIE